MGQSLDPMGEVGGPVQCVQECGITQQETVLGIRYKGLLVIQSSEGTLHRQESGS